MGKIEKIMHSCRYWKNVTKTSKKYGDAYVHYSDHEDLKPDVKNKIWDKDFNGISIFRIVLTLSMLGKKISRKPL